MRKVAECLAKASEVRKIVVFGSFLVNEYPNDMDIAVFQDSDESYIRLAMKYRALARPVSAEIPLDIIPLKQNTTGSFLDEVNSGEVIYEC